jgi:hypothetical protein
MAEGGPAFVRFELDGHPISWEGLEGSGKSGKLSVFMSMFSSTTPPSPLHLAVCLSLSLSLSSFASSQTLSRLSATSTEENVGEEDFRIVRGCVKRHKNTVTDSTPLHLERIKTKLAHLSYKAGYNTNEQREFSQLVQKEFEKSEYGEKCVKTKDGIYYNHKQHSSDLGVWVILRIRHGKNVFEVKVCHPTSKDDAWTVSSEVLEMVFGVVKRAHQIVKLKELNSTRLADPIMLPEDHVPEEDNQGDENKQNPAPVVLPSPLPELACPLVFETTFPINHRLKTSETRRALQTTVLHPFGVSNRAGAFVYKDELDRVFWIRMVSGEGSIGLKVYGIDPPGPSITQQLTSILRARISSFALDALSIILRNNTRFTIELKDLVLLKSFGNDDGGSEGLLPDGHATRRRETLLLPKGVGDPFLFLLFLRNNVCGSGFFHVLNAEVGAERFFGWDDAEEGGSGGSAEDYREEERECEEDPDDDGAAASLPIETGAFTFYYNSSRATLDTVTTLTQKGAAFGRSAGKGIAVVRFTLVGVSGGRVRVGVGESRGDSGEFGVGSATIGSGRGGVSVKMEVHNTTLNLDVLSSWMKLCVDQSVADVVVERLLRKSKQGLIAPAAGPRGPGGGGPPGSAELRGLLEYSLQIPTMSVERVECTTHIR